MPKKKLLIFLATIGLIIITAVVVYYLQTQRQEIEKKAAGDFKQLYFLCQNAGCYGTSDGAAAYKYEAILSYKFEYPKFIWKFDKLSCADKMVLVQRAYLHVADTWEGVKRENVAGGISFEWSPGGPLPSGEIDVSGKGCFFQLDGAMTIKENNSKQQDDEKNFVSNSTGGAIEGCEQTQPTATPTTGISPTVTQRPSPTLTPTPTAGLSPTASVTPLNTPTLTPIPPTSTPFPTSTPMPSNESFCDYIAANPVSGQAPLTVSFSGKGYDKTRVKAYRFTFGDGENKLFEGSFTSDHIQTVQHTYQNAGDYIAQLEIMDDGDHWRTRNECKVALTATQQVVSRPPTIIPLNEPTPTNAQLPAAGITLPSLGGILAGFLLVSLCLIFVF